jgi:hypothetical protein
MDSYTLSITFSRRGLITAGIFVSIALIFTTLTGAGSSAEASGSKALCVTKKGTVQQRSTCKSGERNLAPGKVKTVNLPTRIVRNGAVKMRSLTSQASAKPQALTTSVSGQTVNTYEIATSGVIAVTEKVSFPANWIGHYNGTCPAFAPIAVGWGSYDPATGGNVGDHFSYASGVSSAQFMTDEIPEGDHSTPTSATTLYITQLCAPIVDYVPAQ